jgi:hypothetical protein
MAIWTPGDVLPTDTVIEMQNGEGTQTFLEFFDIIKGSGCGFCPDRDARGLGVVRGLLVVSRSMLASL